MFMPTVMNDNLFDDWFDDDFYMPAFPDMISADLSLHYNLQMLLFFTRLTEIFSLLQ